MTIAVEVFLLPRLVDATRLPLFGLAVVIDTLRFTTTACQALHNGAAQILAVTQVEQALEQARQGVLLCGERHCRPIDGFDLGNSPSEYEQGTVKGKQLVFTTTNGTLAVGAVASVRMTLLGALVNRAALCERLVASGEPHVCVVCAGTDGEIALEDVLAAGAIVDGHETLVPKGDAAHLALAAWHDLKNQPGRSAHNLAERFKCYAGGANLLEAGYKKDLDFAAQIDSIGVVPCSSGSLGLFRA